MIDGYVKGISHKIEEKPRWAELATFVPNKKTPVYNWFYYKEGFARELVFNILDMFRHDAGMPVLDQFCGSGTVLLACKELGLDAIGFDVLPVSVFASSVKTRDYKAAEIREIYSGFRRKFEPIPAEFPSLMKRAFSKYALQDISFLMRDINAIEDEKYRDFFLLALMNAAMKCSYARKDGGAIKIKKYPVAPLHIMFRNVLRKMARDIRKLQLKSCDIRVESCDARNMRLKDSSIGSIVTSPPYLNNIDYTKVYALEEFFVQEKGLPPLRSYIGSKIKSSPAASDGRFNELPPQAVSYFADMEKALLEMRRVCMPDSNIGIVVGNGYLPGSGVVDSDIILSYLAEGVGFSLEKIFVLNKRFALENRTTKVGTLRESLLWLKK